MRAGRSSSTGNGAWPESRNRRPRTASHTALRASSGLAAAQHAGRLAQRLLSFGRVHPDNPKPFRLSKVVRDMLMLVEHSLGDGIELEFVDHQDVLFVHAIGGIHHNHANIGLFYGPGGAQRRVEFDLIFYFRSFA